MVGQVDVGERHRARLVAGMSVFSPAARVPILGDRPDLRRTDVIVGASSVPCTVMVTTWLAVPPLPSSTCTV